MKQLETTPEPPTDVLFGDTVATDRDALSDRCTAKSADGTPMKCKTTRYPDAFQLRIFGTYDVDDNVVSTANDRPVDSAVLSLRNSSLVAATSE